MPKPAHLAVIFSSYPWEIDHAFRNRTPQGPPFSAISLRALDQGRRV
jgi:hypothetical protein